MQVLELDAVIGEVFQQRNDAARFILRVVGVGQFAAIGGQVEPVSAQAGRYLPDLVFQLQREFLLAELAHQFGFFLDQNDLAAVDHANPVRHFLGFIIGIWADGFEKLQVIPLLIITPLTFLGGSFYSIDILPPFWKAVALFNPVVYLISGFRWSFYGTADVSVEISLVMTLVFLAVFIGVVAWIFKTGYRLKS